MKKIILTSVMALSIIGSANAIQHLDPSMQSPGGWIDRIGGSAGEDMNTLQPVFHAAMNNLANIGEDHAKELERQGQIMADWNVLMFGENGDMTSGLFYQVYRNNPQTINALSLNSEQLNNELHRMNRELSAGIANVAALSAVAVSDVKQGEVSVGGGYGYHNTQSAAAVGTAIGLTDWWSVNAGIGFTHYDVTVRAGTNMKFQLF